MKKTIIAILALSGVAFGAVDATTLNNRVDSLIEYYGGSIDNYTLTFTVDGGLASGGSGGFLKLTDSWGLFAQMNQYLGITTVNGNGGWNNPNDWSLKGITAIDNDNCYLDGVQYASNDSLVVARKNDPYSDAYAPLTEGDDRFWLIDTGANGLTGITIELTAISMGDAGGMTVINITNPSEEYYVSNYIGSALDLSKINFEVAGTAASLTVGEATHDLTQPIPEPATATLSLMALAGLAARRRRK